VLHDKGDALEEKDAHVMRALGLDVQFLIDAQENIKVCRFCPLSGYFHICFNFCLYKLHYQFKLMIEYTVFLLWL
jgi:hypothetical protein